MKASEKKFTRMLFSSLVFLFFASLPGIQNAYSESSLLPGGLVIKDDFKPGIGSPVGKILLVQGDVIIIHAGTSSGYQAARNIPLFKGDTVITLKKGRVRFSFNDSTMLTLASETKLVINKSVYDSEKKSRSSFLGMTLGKARFLVKKLTGFKHSEFKVKTKTAVVGVRGSDFIIIASENLTEITALEKTDLEVVSLAKPEDTRILQDFQQTVVETESLPSGAEKIPTEIIEQMKKVFIITPKIAETKKEIKVHKQRKKPSEKKPVGPSEVKIIVSDDMLAMPEDSDIVEDSGDIIEQDSSKQAETVLEKQEEISQDLPEVIRKELADFPAKIED